MRVWVKICGITRVEDALAAFDYGADAIGLNFSVSSERFCSLERAAEIVSAVPAGSPVFGVFVRAMREQIERTIEATGISGVQFHGEEPLEELEGWDLPVLRAVPVRDPKAVRAAIAEGRGQHHRVLLDHGSGGGSGRRFDESLVTGIDLSGVVVAGGLTPENVAGVVRRYRPWGVDTAGGVERAPGVKDSSRIREFIERAKTAR